MYLWQKHGNEKISLSKTEPEHSWHFFRKWRHTFPRLTIHLFISMIAYTKSMTQKTLPFFRTSFMNVQRWREQDGINYIKVCYAVQHDPFNLELPCRKEMLYSGSLDVIHWMTRKMEGGSRDWVAGEGRKRKESCEGRRRTKSFTEKSQKATFLIFILSSHPFRVSIASLIVHLFSDHFPFFSLISCSTFLSPLLWYKRKREDINI